MAEHPHDMLPADPANAEAREDGGEFAERIEADDPYPPELPATVEGDPDQLAEAARQRARPAKNDEGKSSSSPAPPVTSPDEPPLPFGNKGKG